MRTLVKTGLMVTTLAGVIGCGAEPKEPARAPTQTTGAPTGMQAPPPAQQPTTEARPTTEAKPQEGTPRADATKGKQEGALSDAEIVAVVQTVNTGEVEMAELAKKNAASPEVKSFAVMMVTDHTDAANKGKIVSEKARVSPMENETSLQMKSEMQTTTSNLKNQKGKDFDRAYIDAQVKAHRDLLDAIDNKLLPGAQSADLKTHLTELRRHIATHLAKAEELQQKMKKK
jgi:putative membrane protein